MNPENVEAFLEQDYLRDSKKTIKELVKEVSGKTGENVQVTQIVRLG
jgi:translation elongation factor EF-Ts